MKRVVTRFTEMRGQLGRTMACTITKVITVTCRTVRIPQSDVGHKKLELLTMTITIPHEIAGQLVSIGARGLGTRLVQHLL